MKILLLKPITENKKNIYTVHPLSLGYLATALRKKHDVRILDCENTCTGENRLREYVREFKPDIAGITAFSHNKRALIRTIGLIRSEKPDAIVVIGGPHVNARGVAIYKDVPGFDFALQGESEVSLPLLITMLEEPHNRNFAAVPGLIYRDPDLTVHANPTVVENDITRFDPMPYDLVGIQNYFKGLPQGVFSKHKKLVSIVTSRGCPFPCTFCAAAINNGKQVRYRNIENVMSEIELLIKDYGVKEIHILDDNFTFSKDYAKTFCNEIEKRDIRVALALPNGIRLDKVDDELLSLMKKAGFYSLSFGIESGSDETLKKIKKLETTKFIRQQVEFVKNYGFRLTGTFIIGFPWETEKDIFETLAFAKSLPLDHAAFGNFTPLPGTEITEELIRSGELSGDYEVPFTWGEITYSPKAISAARLKILQRMCVLKFYIPSRLPQLLGSIRFSNMASAAKRAMLLFK